MGINDKKCLLEARIEGRQPIVVIQVVNNYEQAVHGAIDKLKSSLATITERLRNN